MTPFKRTAMLIITAVVVAGAAAVDVRALSATERDAIRGKFPRWAMPTQICGAPGTATGAGTPLEGHSLPAASGGTGVEDPLTPEGRVIFNDGSLGNEVAFSNLIPKLEDDAAKSQLYRDYYITMRWNYISWNWDGSPGGEGPEDKVWYSKPPKNEPRRVLVTNPETKRSIIAVVLEAGPAPWTGVTTSKDSAIPVVNGQPVWENPTVGTPANYKGRVSGLAPKAFQALQATMRMTDGSGVDLQYSWAPDQTALPGPFNGTSPAAAAATPTSAVVTAACSSDLSGNLRRDTSGMHCPTATGITEVPEVQDGYALGQLIKIRLCSVYGVQVNVLVALNIRRMIDDAKAAGLNLTGHGFRTMQGQIDTRRANGCTVITDVQACLKNNACVKDTACPGYSNHQMGLAVDWASSGKLIKIGVNPSTRPAFDWLKANAASYGFKNLPSENWHWSVDGG